MAERFVRGGFPAEAARERRRAPPAGAVHGAKGIALTDLRPVGRAEIGGKRYEVRCQTGHVPSGARIEVIASEFGSLLVRPI